MLQLSIGETHLDLHLTGLTAVLARRRCVRLPRERIHKAFVLGRSFATAASPRLPCPGWSTRRHRVGVFGVGDTAQLWATGSRPVVLALYLRGEPYHRIVCEVADPVLEAAGINRWLRYGATEPRPPTRPPTAPRTRRCREQWSGEWRTGQVAHAGTAAVDSVVDLLAAGARTEDLAAAIDRAAHAARRLVGWPTGDAMTRLLSTAHRCARHRAGTHTTQTCADLADALRAVQEALRFDGFLPAITHPEPADAVRICHP